MLSSPIKATSNKSKLANIPIGNSIKKQEQKKSKVIPIVLGSTITCVGAYTLLTVCAKTALYPGITCRKDPIYSNKKLIVSEINIKGLRGATYKKKHPEGEKFKGKYVIVFPGNYMLASEMIPSVEPFLSEGATIVAVDYPGYGSSKLRLPALRLNQKKIYEAGDNIFDYVNQTLGIPEQEMIIFGYSLGGAIASHVFAKSCQKEKAPHAVILASPLCGVNKVSIPIAEFVTGSELNTVKNFKDIEKIKDTSKIISLKRKTKIIILGGGRNDWLSDSVTGLSTKLKHDGWNPDIFISTALGHCDLTNMISGNFNKIKNSLHSDLESLFKKNLDIPKK
ncbi:MAG: hypothetical protein NkDv07_0898 [Candidatus Improbicoccus devescovinae]|nr:MAG: hypothetical protein NkDv07_0898 [Candidatus Improbicoccus devescovinae]